MQQPILVLVFDLFIYSGGTKDIDLGEFFVRLIKLVFL